MDTAQWPQEIVVKPLEEIVTNTTCQKQQQQQVGGLDGRKVSRPQKEQALNCPRCNSTNTKFCYYNNYSLTQPRYFCKTCRRYWTEGGSLRNIPVGGGSRKNKRSSTTSTPNPSSSPSMSKMVMINNKLPDLVAAPPPTTLHHHHQGQDLNLATFPSIPMSELVQVPNNMDPQHNKAHISSSSAMELLNGITNNNSNSSSRGCLSFSSFLASSAPHDPMFHHTNGFSLHDFKPTLSFTLDGIGSYQDTTPNGNGNVGNNGGRVLFPFEDLKQVGTTPRVTNNSNNDDDDNDQENRGEQGDVSTGGGYWSGMLGGGSW